LPTDLYLKVMEEGIRETYPNLSKEKLNNYLKLIVNNRCNTAV